MNNLVIYLITQPLSDRNYDRFGIRYWLERNWKVKVYDFSMLLYPIYWDFVKGYEISCNFNGLYIFDDLEKY